MYDKKVNARISGRISNDNFVSFITWDEKMHRPNDLFKNQAT